MSRIQSYTFTFLDNFTITYPLNPYVHLRYAGSNSSFEGTIPSYFLKMSFCLGGFYLVSLAARVLYKSLSWFYRAIKSRFTAIRALKDQPDKVLGTPKKYAVIYGAANQIGSAYARYFALRGFNLVIIDESEEKLNTLEGELNSILDARNFYQPILGGNPQAAQPPQAEVKERIKIKKVGIEFDKGEIAVKKLEFRLRSFTDNQDWAAFLIDCKNLKIKDGADFHIYECPLISKISSYNSQGSALVLKVILKNMLHFKFGNLIQILNTNENKSEMHSKHALYLATTDFKTSLFQSLRASHSDTPLRFLSVCNNPKLMKTEKHRDRLVEKSIRYLGVYNEITL